jgi:hypothetical protein
MIRRVLAAVLIELLWQVGWSREYDARNREA